LSAVARQAGCAAALVHFLGENTRITLVESDAIGTIGVGEASIPQIRMFNQALGIDETDFIRATGATFKLGIEFAGWLRPGHSYLHAFGDVGRDIGLGAFRHFWSRAHRLGLARPLGDYSVNDLAARAGKMHDGAPLTNRNVPQMPHAFHFDAGRYAAYLRRYAESRGVIRQEGTIVAVERDGGSGDISGVTLADQRRIDGDLFIDCSGLKGLLIEECLGTGFDDWSHLLPANSAVAVPCASAAPLTPTPAPPPMPWAGNGASRCNTAPAMAGSIAMPSSVTMKPPPACSPISMAPRWPIRA
jgi:tryptophan halogenase